MPLLNLGGPLPLRFELNYRHDQYWSFQLNRFQHNLDPYLERFVMSGQPIAEVTLRNGITPQFTYNAGANQWNLDAASPVRYVLKETAGYWYLMDPVQERVYIFQKVTWGSRILYVLDRNGNRLTSTYTGSNMYPDRVEDGLGRRFDFTYASNRLQRVTDQQGRFIQFNYQIIGECAGHGGDWVLVRSVSDAGGNTTTFRYTYGWGCQVTAVDRPGGNTPYTETIAVVTLNNKSLGRVTAQTDAYGNTTTFGYDSTTNRVTETRPGGATTTYEHYHNDGVPKSLTDATGKTINYSQSTNEQVTQVTDRLGDSTNTTYHAATGKMASYQNAQGQTTTFTHTAQNQTITNPANAETVDFTFYNLTRVTYADATHDDLTYDANGNMLTFADRRGKTSTITYNSRGQPLTITNPTGGIGTFTYNADGTLASSADSDAGIGATTYAYDGYKRLSTITRPGGATVQFTYDLNDRLLTMTDERGKTTTFTYDANGNLDTARNPLNQTYTYAQDLMDRVTSITDPLTRSSAYTYDALSRLASTTDRNGNTTTYGYNTRNWRTGVTDPAGQTWTTTYDDEGVPTGFTTPLGRTTTFLTNKLGRVTRITDPLGGQTNFAYDALNRLTTFTDRMGRATTYTYDATGRLASAAKPVIGTATYTRNDAGLLTRITDQRGKNWDFGYSAMGRLASQTDPLGRQRAYAYDNRGRLSQITYPGGAGTATYTYDAASHVTQIAYSGGPTLNYTYDDAGRLLTANNLALTRDARGNITNSQDGGASFGATYDNGRRLATLTYDGQATVTYTYNSRDLLTRVEDNRAGAWMNFAYDNDGRLTGITRSNGVGTTFTYDNVGRVTRIQDGALADQQYTLNAEGEPTQVARTLPLDPNLQSQISNLSFDDAAQISSAGYAYDARGRQTAAPGKTFGYDGASRLTQVSASGSTATFTYNGMNDLRTRVVGGATTTYYHNYALRLDPIVAEKEGASYKRLYVYAPNGALLYSIDPAANQARFYHFDRIGSTLFLTNGSGAVSDAYAYDPYGNMLGQTGSSDQPFTYVGQFGVRRESVGNLYDMRARAYDPASARFLTRDPVWPTLTEPEALNPYQYANQNPLRYIDPRGTATVYSAMGKEELLNAYLWGKTKEEREAALKEIKRRNERQRIADMPSRTSSETLAQFWPDYDPNPPNPYPRDFAAPPVPEAGKIYDPNPPPRNLMAFVDSLDSWDWWRISKGGIIYKKFVINGEVFEYFYTPGESIALAKDGILFSVLSLR